MTFISTKTWGHDIGLSSCFRQHRAKSHCKFLHGYALAVRVEFEAVELDENHWVIDFGSLKSFKGWLETTFDHKLLIAEDDPERSKLMHLKVIGVADIVLVPATGCEAFAKLIYECAEVWLHDNGHGTRVTVRSVEVSEHGANSAIYTGSGLEL
jgi:6-pyruvoyltetrahydropterin/6-carboxytetrahydropterin synthase